MEKRLGPSSGEDAARTAQGLGNHSFCKVRQRTVSGHETEKAGRNPSSEPAVSFGSEEEATPGPETPLRLRARAWVAGASSRSSPAEGTRWPPADASVSLPLV